MLESAEMLIDQKPQPEEFHVLLLILSILAPLTQTVTHAPALPATGAIPASARTDTTVANLHVEKVTRPLVVDEVADHPFEAGSRGIPRRKMWSCVELCGARLSDIDLELSLGSISRAPRV